MKDLLSDLIEGTLEISIDNQNNFHCPKIKED